MFGYQSEKIVQSYWILGLAQVVHSMEETYTQLYCNLNQELDSIIDLLRQYIPSIPSIVISADVFAILNYVMLALILGSIPIAEKGNRLGFILMWSWGIIELLNGAFHIGTWVFLHHYFPGGISGPILFILSVMFIQQLREMSTQPTQVIQ